MLVRYCVALFIKLRILRDEKYPHMNILEGFGVVLVFCTGLLIISHQWQPELEDGKQYTWVELQEEKAPQKVDLQDIANLVGGDTGEDEKADMAELAKFVDKSSEEPVHRCGWHNPLFHSFC